VQIATWPTNLADSEKTVIDGLTAIGGAIPGAQKANILLHLAEAFAEAGDGGKAAQYITGAEDLLASAGGTIFYIEAVARIAKIRAILQRQQA